ncbi:thioesterase domain-containing protein [Bacillus smithii]|nr:thioesterase domain-containing protein [Bacillus smithii]
MKVFCLGYAGSSKTVFRDWLKNTNKIEFIPLEYKGRGTRFNENSYTDIVEAVDDMYELIKFSKGNEKYAIFGHSMGAYISYELYYKLKNSQTETPEHLFLSGINPPMLRKSIKISHLDDDTFLEQVVELGGIPSDLLKHKDVLNFFLPILRNDFRIVEEYKYEYKSKKIDCGLTIILGSEDKLTQNYNNIWREMAEKEVEFYELQGNHFFLHNHTELLKDIIYKNLMFEDENKK